MDVEVEATSLTYLVPRLEALLTASDCIAFQPDGHLAAYSGIAPVWNHDSKQVPVVGEELDLEECVVQLKKSREVS